ncbi:MAG TPA: formate dehydrogenase accessory sulfurtransferase FdhD [Kofleriaceae bacterium]|nr:formate dehydrogenase accessory sulfurtransferase FdhD [Kofleriaceae bacterium]
MIVKRVEKVAVADGLREGRDDAVVDEAPLTITARGQEVAVTLRTPGHDLELVRGMLHAEIGPAAATAGMRQLGPDRVDVDVAPEAMPARSFMATAACGTCGRVAIAALEPRARPITAEDQVAASLVAALPGALRQRQAEFAATGGLHATGLFDLAGRAVLVREDVGRHNALDKLIGAALAAGCVPLSTSIVVLSGRIGYELVEKAVLAGVPIVAAVSAPTRLAIDVAERFNVTLCGFVRDRRFNIYSHGWRITGP